jgi:hypothetical protein
MSRNSLAVLLALPIVCMTSAAIAQRKPQPACNLKAMPFTQGKEWVYTAVAPPAKAPIAKPRQPAVLTLKVVEIKTEGTGKDQKTLITVEETADARTLTTVLTCAKDALWVPPQSVLFSGEPGGGLQMTLGEVVRGEDSAPSYKFYLGTMRIPEWIEDMKATFTRTPTEGTGVKLVDGALDLQRIVLIGLPEEVSTALGSFQATPVQVDLRGSVTLNVEPEAKEFNIPANTISKLWFAENVGVVQIYNTNGHMYQLKEVKTPEPQQPPR